MTRVPVASEDLDQLLDDLVNAQTAIEAAGTSLLSYRKHFPNAPMVESHTRTMEGRHGLIDYCVRHALDHVYALIRLQEQADRDELDDAPQDSSLVEAALHVVRDYRAATGESQHDPDQAPTAS